MGDRGNIVIESKEGQPKLYFYTHWTGSDLPNVVSAALARGRERWDDEPYLNRVLFQNMIAGDNGITGFGIDTEMGDGGTEVYVCPAKQTVRFREKTFTFQEFIDAKHDEREDEE